MSNIAILNSHTLWPVHYETELEIIQNHLASGDVVYQVVCDGSLKISDLNMEGDSLKCLQCIRKRKKGVTLLTGRSNFHVLPYNLLSKQEKKKIQDANFTYSSVEDLKALKVENFDIGLAVLSSISSTVRDSALDIDTYKATIDRYLLNSLMIFYSTKKLIDKYNLSRYYIFNGRFAYPRAVFRACQQKQIDCFIHEVGSTIHKYDLFFNQLPHNIKFLQGLIEDSWENSPKEKRESIGRLWFEERIKAIPQNYTSFVSGQDPNKLPATWDRSKHNIVIFNSSEDEMVSIGDEWKNPLYKDQLEGIQQVVERLSCFAGVKIYLRMHPNLQDVNDDYVKTLKKLKGHNFELIDSLSTVSTYLLIKSANKVVTFGSSTGVEAAYLGTPSILLGASYYKGKSCVYEPVNQEEVIDFLTDFKLKPIISDFPLKYGYYFKTRGIEFQHYKASKLHHGSFRGVDLNAYRSLISKFVQHRFFNNRIARNPRWAKVYKRIVINLANF